VIEFIKESHTYLVDGVITPSVSQILAATIFKNKYANIPEFIMKRAAHYGTNVHNAIELNDWIGLTDESILHTIITKTSLKRNKTQCYIA